MSALYDIFRASTGVTTDSRTISEGLLFFALRGASFDGNRFAIDALHKGASVAVVDDATVIENAPEELSERLFLVENTLTALQDLAREHREVLAIPILSVAGSNGKTTTKELVARVLAEKYEVYATRGNLNNHIGVPLTLLAMDQTTEFGVVEMGASACGEIALLVPTCGIFTTVDVLHYAFAVRNAVLKLTRKSNALGSDKSSLSERQIPHPLSVIDVAIRVVHRANSPTTISRPIAYVFAAIGVGHCALAIEFGIIYFANINRSIIPTYSC